MVFWDISRCGWVYGRFERASEGIFYLFAPCPPPEITSIRKPRLCLTKRPYKRKNFLAKPSDALFENICKETAYSNLIYRHAPE
jgi:hypothetical protein